MNAAVKAALWPVIVALLALVLFQVRIRREMPDFAVYWMAGTRAAHAEPLYRADDGHYQFKYLPAFALAMTPLSLLDQRAAKALWFALSVGLLTAYVRWAVRVLPERRWPDRTLTWIAVILMAKFLGHELLLGQTNLLLGVLLMAALLAAEIDHPSAAAILIALAVLVKPYALLMLPWLAATKGIKPALLSVAVLAAGLLAPAAVYGWDGNIALLGGWYRTVTDTTMPNLLNADNISLAAMWAKWIGPGATATLLANLSALAAIGLAAAVWSQRKLVAEPDYLEFSLLMLLVPLLSPQGWDYVLLLATPAVVCLVDRWREVGTAWRWLIAVAMAAMSFSLFNVMGRTLYGQFMALSLVTVCAIVLALGLAHLRRRALA